MTKHELKTWPEYFFEVSTGKKKFEVRLNDRDFKVGDRVILNEWNPKLKKYTGLRYTFVILYILHGGNFGIEEGYCVMSFDKGGML